MDPKEPQALETPESTFSDAGFSEADRQLVLRALDESLARLHKALEGITEEEARATLEPGSWSVLEIVEHLTLSESAYGDLLSPRLLALAPSQRQRNKIKWTDEALLHRIATPESKATSPELGRPANRFSTLAQALEAFGKIRQRTRDLAAGYTVDLRMRVFPHPALGPIDGVQWMLFQAAHCVRHTKQIERIRRERIQAAQA
jgi:hypothetical protein